MHHNIFRIVSSAFGYNNSLIMNRLKKIENSADLIHVSGTNLKSLYYFSHIYFNNNLFVSERAAEMTIPIKPDLIIMDGRISFVSGGPAIGLAVHPGVILASGDPVALDVQGVRLLQNYAAVNHLTCDAWNLPQIKTAVKHGLGIKGDDELRLIR